MILLRWGLPALSPRLCRLSRRRPVAAGVLPVTGRRKSSQLSTDLLGLGKFRVEESLYNPEATMRREASHDCKLKAPSRHDSGQHQSRTEPNQTPCSQLDKPSEACFMAPSTSTNNEKILLLLILLLLLW